MLWLALFYSSLRLIIVHIFFLIHSYFGGHLVCFHVLAIVNSAVINTGLHVSFQVRVFSGYMPRSRVAGSYCNSSFSFVRNFHAAFYSGCTNLHSHQQYGEFPFHYTSSAFVTYRLFNDLLKRYLIVVLICCSLIISKIEHLFMCLLAICVCSLEKCRFRSAHFWIAFPFLLLSCVSSSCILEIKPLSVASFANIFLSLGFVFAFCLQFPFFAKTCKFN